MSPLKIALLLRMYAYVKPNADLPEQQAFAPAMGQALADFIAAGLVIESATLTGLRHDARDGWLTEKGVTLVESSKRAGDGFVVDHGCTMFPPPTRPAPPMPKIKPPRPDYETMLRDEWIGRAMTGAMSRGWRNPKDVVSEVNAVVDAMLEARNANR